MEVKKDKGKGKTRKKEKKKKQPKKPPVGLLEEKKAIFYTTIINFSPCRKNSPQTVFTM